MSTDPEELDKRMAEAGMVPLSKLLNCDHGLSPFIAHAGVVDLETFGQWLKRKHEEYLRMKIAYALGDTPVDELYEWIFAHSAVFEEVLTNWNKATQQEK